MNTNPSSSCLLTNMTYLGLNYSCHLLRHWFIEGLGVFEYGLSPYVMCNFFSSFCNSIPYFHVLRISKWLKLQKPDCIHWVDFFKKFTKLTEFSWLFWFEVRKKQAAVLVKILMGYLYIFSPFSKRIPLIHLHRISKRFELQRRDCTHCVDFFQKFMKPAYFFSFLLF